MANETTKSANLGENLAAALSGKKPARKPAAKKAAAPAKKPAAKKAAAPAKKPAGKKPVAKVVVKRSAAAKHAEPVPTKRTSGKRLAPMIASHDVHNVGALVKLLSTFPTTAKLDTDRKFGVPQILVNNVRGKHVATINMRPKVAKAASK